MARDNPNIAIVTRSAPWPENPFHGVSNMHLARAIAETGAGVRVFCPTVRYPPPITLAKKRFRGRGARPANYDYGGVRFEAVPGVYPPPPFLRWQVAPRAPRLAAWMATQGFVSRLERSLRVFVPDAILIHDGATLGPIGPRVSRSLGVPYAIIERDAVDEPADSKLGRFYARTHKEAKAVISVGHRWLPHLRTGLGLSQAVAIPNGVAIPDPNIAPPSRPPDFDDAFLILCVGYYAERKGHALLISALASTPSRAVLVLVGEPPQHLLDLASSLGVRSRIHIVPQMPQEKLMHWMAWADLFALPSWWEGFGNVYAEAMANRTPVLLTTDCGMASYIEHGVHGWIVPPRNQDAVNAAINEAIVSDRLGEMGDAGRSLMEQQFSWRSTAERVLAALGFRENPPNSENGIHINPAEGPTAQLAEAPPAGQDQRLRDERP